MSILALTFRFALAIVLGVAAFAKARSFDDFTRMVEAIVPRRRGVSVVAAGVVAIEAALAVLLAAGVMPSVAAAATVLLVFAAISVWAARHGLHVQRNCFGRSGRELGKESLTTSALLAVAGLADVGYKPSAILFQSRLLAGHWGRRRACASTSCGRARDRAPSASLTFRPRRDHLERGGEPVVAATSAGLSASAKPVSPGRPCWQLHSGMGLRAVERSGFERSVQSTLRYGVRGCERFT